MIRFLAKTVIEGVILLALLYGSFYLAIKVMPKTRASFSIGSGQPGVEACILSIQFEKIVPPQPSNQLPPGIQIIPRQRG